MESYLDFLNWTNFISLRWWFLANIFSISVLSFFSLLYRFFSISTDNSNLYKSFIRVVLYFQFQWRGLELNRYLDVWERYPENWRIYFHLFSSQEVLNPPLTLHQWSSQSNHRNILWTPPHLQILSNLLTYQIQTRISGRYLVRHILTVRFKGRSYFSWIPLMISMFCSDKYIEVFLDGSFLFFILNLLLAWFDFIIKDWLMTSPNTDLIDI